MKYETRESKFGNWINLDQRLEELSKRLYAWTLSGREVSEIFTEAQRKMKEGMYEYDEPMDAPKELLLEAFEDSLDAFDCILRECRT